MTWNDHHSNSEGLSASAESLRKSGDVAKAVELYCESAREEVLAYDALGQGKVRTRGVTAVSAVALFYKGQEYVQAEQLAYRFLASDLPSFATDQLRSLLQIIWTTHSAHKAGIAFVPGDVLVSVRGGQVIHGGAPLHLIVQRVEGIQAVLFRTVEMLLDRPFRRRGEPDGEIQAMFRPWLFQAPAGSYQFAVRMQQPEQMDLWEANRPQLEEITNKFFAVIRASASSPERELPLVVPDADYRGAFLKLARSLAPTGKSFDRLEICDASAPAEPIVALGTDTRAGLNGAIRKLRPPTPAPDTLETTVAGTLRAVHLDEDWLEITQTDDTGKHLRIEEAGEALDDVVGPMVNRRVIVSVLQRGAQFLYRDIELAE